MDSTGGRRRRRRLLKISFVLVACFAAGLVAAGTVAGAGPFGAISSLASATDDTGTTSTDTTTTTNTDPTTGTTATDPTGTTPTDTTPTESSPTDTTPTETVPTDTTPTPPPPVPSGPPTLVSDKDDYMPGETVVLTGANWKPGEPVRIVVNDDQGQIWSRTSDVVADLGGNIRDEFALPNTFVALYTATATGPLSGTASTTWTDGTVAARNATTTPAAVTINYTLERYGNITCAAGSGQPQQTRTFSRTGPASTGGGTSSIASGGTESVKVSVTGVTAGSVFDKWHFVDGNTAGDGIFFSNSQSFCFPTENNTNRTFIAFVKAANTAPTANAVTTSTPEDTPKAITLSGSDAQQCELSFSIVAGPTNGSLGSISNNACTAGSPNTDTASVTYTPNLEFQRLGLVHLSGQRRDARQQYRDRVHHRHGGRRLARRGQRLGHRQ